MPVNEEDDRAIEQALHNATANSEVGLPTSTTVPPSKEDAVKDTLSRFASAPRRAGSVREDATATQDPKGKRQTMDVDSFKRLLLTGASGASGPNAQSTSSSSIPQLQSDSGSNTDTASLSQRSILESGHQTVEETPRSSYEAERGDLDAHRHPRTASGTANERKPPPPPKPRHGRPISETTNVPSEQSNMSSSRENSSPYITPRDPSPALSGDATPRLEPEEDITQTSAKKKPPPPPLARRKSQNKTVTRPGVVRSGSSRHSLTSESDEPMSPLTPSATTKMAPPPPPTRRMNSQSGRRPSADLPSTLEEDDSGDDAASISSSRALPASKRMSQASFGAPPPLPPPRKNRGSNRSSTDGQRPAMSTLGLNNASARSSFEHGRPGSTTASRDVSGNTNAGDILADLAALQREVDAARKSAGT